MSEKKFTIEKWGRGTGKDRVHTCYTVDYRKFPPLSDLHNSYPLIQIEITPRLTQEEALELANTVCDALNADWVKRQLIP